MADFDDSDMDGGAGQGGGTDQASGSDDRTPTVQRGLLDPKTFPSPLRRLTQDAPSIEPQPQTITGPLKVDLGSEVLQDILNAQAKLNGQKTRRLAPRPETWSVNGQPYFAISARTFDPALSNQVTSMPRPADSAAAFAGRKLFSAPDGDSEKAGFIVGSPSRLILAQGTAHSTDNTSTFKYKAPAGSPRIHGHIDGGSHSSDGMVDNTEEFEGYGDTDSFRANPPVPTATVSHGGVGWHVMDNGQLKFLYPPGSMDSFQIGKMQQNLDQEQKKFLRPK